MYPLHDDDLDRLSREAAEHFEVEPGASGWAHLEKRLDEELPQKKKRWRFLFWLFFITATTGGALTAILTYKPLSPVGKNAVGVVSTAQKPATAQQQEPGNTSLNQEVKTNPVTGNTSTPVTPEKAEANQNPVTGNDPAGQAGSPVTASPVPAGSKRVTAGAHQAADASVLNTSPEKNATQPISKTHTPKRSKPAPQVGADKSPLSLNYATITPTKQGRNAWHTPKPAKNKPGKKQSNKSISPAPDNTTVPDRSVTTNDQQTTANPVEVNNDASTAQTITTPADSTKNKTVVAPATDSAKTLASETPKKAEPKKDQQAKGFELGLMAGPDVSAVKFGPLYKAGYNFGLQVGYRFSNRWLVNTGIIYTKKSYQADGEDFHYKSPWVSKYDKAEGNCSMWEIPVNVRYDFSFNNKRRWFASTGLSTYLMDKENYDLYYTTPNGVQHSYPLSSDSNTNYLFSIWNLSAGMERSLGKHFSIQAEPYLKVPLQGLGKGSIRMDSYGIYFTLKYKPGFRTKRSINNK